MKKFNISFLSFLLLAFLTSSSVLSAQDCGSAGDVNEDLVGDDIPQVYCPGGEITFETDGEDELPANGNGIYVWYIVNVEDQEDIYGLPVFDGANFTGDLNAELENFENDPVPAGSYAVYGWMAVFGDDGEILDEDGDEFPDCFELTENFISLTVLDSSDPECQGTEPSDECGSPGDVNEDFIGDDVAQIYCPGGEVTFENDGTEEFPADADNSVYAWYIVNAEDENDIYAVPATDGANFTGDINAILESFESDILTSGSYFVYGWMVAVDENGDLIPNCFELTENFISLTVLDSSDPDCEGIEPPELECGEPGGIAEDLVGDENAQDYCPGGEITFETDGSETFFNSDTEQSIYVWYIQNVDDPTDVYFLPLLAGTNFTGDLNTAIEEAQLTIVPAGSYQVYGWMALINANGETNPDCVELTQNFISLTVLEEDDPACTGEVECVASYGSITPPANLTICDGDTAEFEISDDENDGYTTIFVITQGDDLIIMGLNYTDEIDFADLSQLFGPPLAYGEYTVHALNYVDSDLPALQGALMDGATGVDVAQLIADGVVCAELDVDGTTITYEDCEPVECVASYGSVTPPNDLTICDGNTAIFDVSNDENDGYTTIFVITQGDDLTIMGLNYTGEIDFANLSQPFGPPLAFGDYTVHALNYVDSDLPALQGALMDGATGVDVAQLIADGVVCAELNVDGTTIAYDDCIPGVANDDLAANGFGFTNVYPSPATDVANVSFLSNNTESVTINLTDIAGKIVSQETMIAQEGENNIVLDTQALSNGVYLISIAKNNAVITTKIMK